MMDKSGMHAYLIMAYNNWGQLALLLELLDDSRNDIYIHVDLRSGNYPQRILKEAVSKSNLFFIPRKKVYWADYSQADVEMDLMQAACKKGKYHYYHLLSGMDLPLKTQDEIHAFFKDKDKEFIAMTPNGGSYSEKHVCYYHFFLHNRFYRKCKLLKAIDRGVMYIQRALGLKRVYQEGLLISTGWQWFSITDDFCRYVLSQRAFIQKMFSYALDVDEKFLGTMINKLGAYDRVYYVTKPGEGNDTFQRGCQRCIDFDRPVPQPYTWGREDADLDYKHLMDSNLLFARKFDETVNNEIILKIADAIKPGISDRYNIRHG